MSTSSPTLRLTPTVRQDEFIRCSDRFTAFIGGIASGKSWAGAAKLVVRCYEQPGLYMVSAPTYPMLRDASMRVLRTVAGPAFPPEALRKVEMLATIGPSEVMFRSADDPDRLRGPNISGAWLDEGALCPRGTWEVIIGRLREGGRAGPCWVTTTPKGRNWLYERSGEMTIFRARTAENPHLDREFVASLEASYDGAFARQELEGEFVTFEGAVYEEFDRARHVISRRGPWVQVIAGMDEGFTNPSVILVIGVDNDGRAHVIEEFYKRRVLQADVIAEAKRLRDSHRITTFHTDPSAAGLIAEMHASGLHAVPANNDVFAGLQAVRGRLVVAGDGKPRLTLDPSCVNTLAEFESYVWREGRQGLRDEPEKVNDHAMDALRYGLMALSQRSPVATKPGRIISARELGFG